MINIPKITPPSPSLPSVYNLQGSYEQQIKLLYQNFYDTTQYVIESIDVMNNIISGLDEGIKKAVQDGIKHVEKEFDNLLNEFANLRTETLADIQEVNNRMEDTIKEVSELVDGLKDYVDSGIDNFQKLLDLSEKRMNLKIKLAEASAGRYTDSAVEEEGLRRKINDMELWSAISDLKFKLPNIYDPTYGAERDVQTVAIRLWNVLRYGCLTAEEWDALNLTADEWDALGWTALEYDTMSKYNLHNDVPMMTSPFTGEKTSVAQVVLDIYSMINFNGKTAKEYDSIGFTAEEFDNSTYDAYQQNTRKWYTDVEPDVHDRVVELSQLLFDNDKAIGVQDIGDVKGFDAFKIVWRPMFNTARPYENVVSEFMVSDGRFRLDFNWESDKSNQRVFRYVDCLDGILTATKGYWQNNTQILTDNGYCVPLKVYGIKYKK